jgi:hypothetical protein
VQLGQDPAAGLDAVVAEPADVAAYREVRAGIPALLERYQQVSDLFR